MLRPLDDVRAAYIPHYSVDHELDVRMYCGHVKAGEVVMGSVEEIG